MQINYVCHPTLYFHEMLMTVARTIQLRYDRSAQSLLNAVLHDKPQIQRDWQPAPT